MNDVQARTQRSRYEELQSVISEYGTAAFQNLIRCQGLAAAIVDGFAAFEGCERAAVNVVPPDGEFDPHRDYGHDAFSFSTRQVVILEPVRFGISLIVGNVEDAGALWLRTALAIELTANHFDVFVSAQPKVNIPLEYADKLDPIFAAIHKEFVETFASEVREFNDARFKHGIGFIPARQDP